MKPALLFALGAVVIGCSRPEATSKTGHAEQNEHGHASHDDGHKSVLIIETEPSAAAVGTPVTLKLMIHEADGTMVREFDVVHEELVHLMIVREGLDEFAHVHPAVDDQGNLTISHVFPKAGKYRFYADYKPTGKPAGIATAQIDVNGEPSPAPKLVVNVPGEVTADGLSATIDVSNAKGGQEAEVRFLLTTESSQPIEELEPYLGARGHLVVISDDGDEYVHAHPMDKSAAPNEVVFMAHFPRAGTYKGWGQFKLSGQVRTIPFVVDVR
jgi:hypothetical protein